MERSVVLRCFDHPIHPSVGSPRCTCMNEHHQYPRRVKKYYCSKFVAKILAMNVRFCIIVCRCCRCIQHAIHSSQNILFWHY